MAEENNNFIFEKQGTDIFDIVGMLKDVSAEPTFTPTKFSDQIKTDGTNGDIYIYSNDKQIWIKVNAFTSPLTTKGDLFGYSTVNARIPIGSDDTVLTADSSETLGVKWATPVVSNLYGSGSDGNVTIPTSGTLTRDMYYNNLTVNGTLDTGGYRLFVKETLTIGGKY